MKTFAATTTINAKPETVWSILTDSSRYPEWDPHMVRLEGTIAVGEKVKAFTTMSPNRAFPATVKELVPCERMTWAGGMPLGLFKTERTFELKRTVDGKTEFSTREQFSGFLLPLVDPKLPDLNPVFAAFADGLKKRAEAPR